MAKNWNNDSRPSFPPSNNNNNHNNNHITNINIPMIRGDHHGVGLFSPSSSHHHASVGRSLFPAKLRQLLDDSELEGTTSIVSWLPHGKAFRVHKPKEFAAKIVGRYFNHGQYRSFTRQLYHYGFGKVDSGEDMGAFYHPNFLRDKPALAFLIGRRKDTPKKKNPTTEKGTEDLTEDTSKTPKKTETSSSPSSSLVSEHHAASIEGFNMIESPFQALVNETNVRIERNEDRIRKQRGIKGLLHQLSEEDQEAMIKHFKGGDTSSSSSFSKLPTQKPQHEQSFPLDEEAGIGLLFGDDGSLEGIPSSTKLSSAPMAQHASAAPQRQSPNDDWFSSIGAFFDCNSFEDEVFGVGFEPRPIEEMAFLSYNLSHNTTNDNNSDAADKNSSHGTPV